MCAVRVSEDYGIVVKRDALQARGVSISALFEAFEATQPFDQDEDLISFGPHFGGEAAQAIVAGLEKLGLKYVEDFYDVRFDVPDWVDVLLRLRA